MIISEYIKLLEKKKTENGDLEVKSYFFEQYREPTVVFMFKSMDESVKPNRFWADWEPKKHKGEKVLAI